MRKIKYDTKKFIERSNIVYGNKFDYSKSIYTGFDKKIIIICKICGEFQRTPQKHILHNKGCPTCDNLPRNGGKKSNTDEFINKAKIIHKDKYDYSLVNYVKCFKPVTIICNKLHYFEQSPSVHLKGGGCSICAVEIRKIKFSDSYKLHLESNRKIRELHFINIANQKHNNFYDYSKINYISGESEITAICPNHGEFKQMPKPHMYGSHCPKCEDGLRKNRFEEKFSLVTFIEKAKLIHKDKYIYSKSIYINNWEKIEIICKKHGSFWQRPSYHLAGCDCQYCAKSGGVSEAEKLWIDSLNILGLERQKIIHINGTKIVADAYDPITNTIYEFNGDYWHGNPKRFKSEDINKVTGKTFGELYQKTLEKENLIKQAGYNLVCKWET